MRNVVAGAVALLALFGAGVAEATDRRDQHRWEGGRRHHDDWRHRGWDRHDRWYHDRDRHGPRHGWRHRHHDGDRVVVVPPRVIYVYPQPFGYW